jgi:general secretion pathway protein H
MIARARRSSRRDAGFTLIEMIVVLVVLGLAMGLVIARGPMRSRTLETRAAASQVVQSLRIARSRAIATNRPVLFTVDVAGRRYSVDGGPPQGLPPALDVSMTTVTGDRLGKNVGAITFAPDGSSTGGRIVLADGGHHLQIGVDWLTGRVSVQDAP